jgi:hypothetical protein
VIATVSQRQLRIGQCDGLRFVMRTSPVVPGGSHRGVRWGQLIGAFCLPQVAFFQQDTDIAFVFQLGSSLLPDEGIKTQLYT